MNEKKRIVFLSGSPKVDQKWAVSAFLTARGVEKLSCDALEIVTISVRHALMHHETGKSFETLQTADAIVLVFPLYFFCMPSMLTRFLQDFAAVYPRTERDAGVYAIINCGFPEPEINAEAMRVVEQFAKKTERAFRGGVLAGCGGMLFAAERAPFMKPVFETLDALFLRVQSDVLSGKPQASRIDETAVKFPRALYFIGGNVGWKSTARKNRLRIRDMYRKPYQK